MKILFANNYYYLRGGSERVFFDEIALLEAHGETIAPFSRVHPQNLSTPYARYFPPALEFEGGSLLEKARAAAKIIYAADAKRGLQQLLDAFQPDLLHGHNIYGRLSSSILDAAATAGLPVVLTLHDYKLICPSYKLESRGVICEACQGQHFHHALTSRCHKGSLLPSAIYTAEAYVSQLRGSYTRKVARLIAPSHFLRAKFIEFGWDGGQIAVVPNFLDATRFEPQFAPGDYFLYLGRLSPEKGLPTLLEAFSRLPSVAQLVVAGSGPQEEELRRRFGATPGLTFAGHLAGERLAATVRGARAVVVPSEWYENAPMSILEAMAWGKPVLAAAIGGIPELVRDGESGLLFAPGDVDALQQRLEQLLRLSAGELAAFGRAGRGVVEEDFSAAAHYQALTAVYAAARAGH